MGKGERTRARLQNAAVTLMAVQGYDATTVEQIAAKAGVTPMTFFRHFPSKSAVLLDDPYDPLIGQAVAAQPEGLPALERVRRGLAEAWAQLPEPARGNTRIRIRIIAATPALRARMWEDTLATQEAIAESLTGTGVTRLVADVAAGACLGAISAALLNWGRGYDGSLADCITFALAELAPPEQKCGAAR